MLLAGPVLPALLGLAIPTATIMLAQIAVGIAEVWYISRLGTTALAGAAMVFPLLILMSTMSAGGVGNGVSSAIARATGAGRHDDAQRIAVHAIVIALGVGLLFTALALLGGKALYSALGASDQVLDSALRYSNAAFAGVTALWLMNLLGAVFRGLGNPLLPAKVSLYGAAFLIPTSPALIFGVGPVPGLGVAGAGWALCIYYVGACSFLLVQVRRHGSLSRQGGLHRRTFADILKVGIPSSLNAIQSSVLAMALTSLAAGFGIDALAAYGIVVRLDTVMVPLLFGLGSAVLTMVGMNVGAENPARARRIALVGASVSIILVGLPGLLLAFAPRIWVGLFTAEPAVLQLGNAYLHISGGSYALLGAAFVLGFALQGAGRALWPTIGVTLRMVLTVTIAWLGVRAGGHFTALAIANVMGLLAYAGVCAIATFYGLRPQPREDAI